MERNQVMWGIVEHALSVVRQELAAGSDYRTVRKALLSFTAVHGGTDAADYMVAQSASSATLRALVTDVLRRYISPVFHDYLVN